MTIETAQSWHRTDQNKQEVATRSLTRNASYKGTQSVKRALFMAAMAARNHNPTLKAVYQRLIHNGKKPLVALTALMRKLITIINARVRDALQMPTPKLS